MFDADLKIFLFADFETRMKRRIKDGELDEIRNRDLKDLQRKLLHSKERKMPYP